ncbi:NAD(+) synthase [Candidatus Ichthyocystis sparus]|uniref:NAD(+) synthase n=1 Tax=Candidatus Ichthyocystis sparus TaxID=1561004 RepID=UPI0011471D45|nr:NAD(+) synthase [Candidatus Ichthyocystis sparus]
MVETLWGFESLLGHILAANKWSTCLFYLSLAQIDNGVVDINERAQKILSLAINARKRGVSVLVTPELSLCGCPPNNAMLQSSFLLACQRSIDWLCSSLPEDIAVTVGVPLPSKENASVVIGKGKIIHTIYQRHYDSSDIMHRSYYFKSSNSPSSPIMWNGLNILFMMEEEEAEEAKNCDLAILIRTCPFLRDHRTRDVAKNLAKQTMTPFVHINGIGGQDSFIFEGSSSGYNPNGECAFRFPSFKEDIQILKIEKERILPQSISPSFLSDEEETVAALRAALSNYCRQHRFSKIVLGVSGGVDSSVALCIAADALGPNNCHGLILPSRFNSSSSIADAQELTQKVGCTTTTISIEPILKQYESCMNITSGIAHENLQARIRAQIIMAYSNKYNALVINTSNKSEISVGYCTLYGDSIGGIALISDLFKTEVYLLARWYRNVKGLISERIINKEPSAELRYNQMDTCSLPEYEKLDTIIRTYIETGSYPDDIPEQECMDVVGKFHQSEYKRRQLPLGPILSKRYCCSPTWPWPTYWPNIAGRNTE